MSNHHFHHEDNTIDQIAQIIADIAPIHHHPRCHGFFDCLGKIGISYLFDCFFYEE